MTQNRPHDDKPETVDAAPETHIDRLLRILKEVEEQGSIPLPKMTREEARAYFFSK